MDRKATQIMVHYKNVIEHRTFDEYDVLGFLIFIREYLCEKKYPFIKDFSHLVAHRGRDRGYIIDAIVVAISNCYKTKRKSNEVVGYYGMKYEKWQEEWKMFGQEYGILIDDRTIEELTVCVFFVSVYKLCGQRRTRKRENKAICRKRQEFSVGDNRRRT